MDISLSTYIEARSMSINHCQSKIFSVARIAELSRSPRRRSRVRELY